MNRTLQLILAATLSSTFAVACADREATAPATVPGGGFTAAITCHATVSTGTLSCGDITPASTRGLNFEIVLGGQDTLVTLAGSNISYNAPTWQADVTVKNLTAQPMHTASAAHQHGEGHQHHADVGGATNDHAKHQHGGKGSPGPCCAMLCVSAIAADLPAVAKPVQPVSVSISENVQRLPGKTPPLLYRPPIA